VYGRGGKVPIVSVGELNLVNAGGGKVAIVSVGELYLVMLVEERLLLSQ
jgi:hypothetical protein